MYYLLSQRTARPGGCTSPPRPSLRATTRSRCWTNCPGSEASRTTPSPLSAARWRSTAKIVSRATGSMSTVGSIEHEHTRTAVEPLADDHFLLVPPLSSLTTMCGWAATRPVRRSGRARWSGLPLTCASSGAASAAACCPGPTGCRLGLAAGGLAAPGRSPPPRAPASRTLVAPQHASPRQLAPTPSSTAEGRAGQAHSVSPCPQGQRVREARDSQAPSHEARQDRDSEGAVNSELPQRARWAGDHPARFNHQEEPRPPPPTTAARTWCMSRT